MNISFLCFLKLPIFEINLSTRGISGYFCRQFRQYSFEPKSMTIYYGHTLPLAAFKLKSSYDWLSQFITTRKRSLGQGNIFAPVCHSVHGGAPPGSTWAGTPWAGTPLGRYTPRKVDPLAGTPPGQVHPWAGTPLPPQTGTPPEQCMLGDMGNKQAVCILLECILVFTL